MLMEDRSLVKSDSSLPYDTNTEASVLGAVLIDNDSLTKIADKLVPDDFFDSKHKEIYRAIIELFNENRPIDVLTLSDRLRANDSLNNIGGAAYLTELTNFVPTAAHLETYADIVIEKSLRRKLLEVNSKIRGLMLDEAKPISDLIEQTEQGIFKLTRRHIKENIVSIEDVLSESFERLDELHKDKGKLRGITTGFKAMDNILAGLQRSDLIILAARPAMGKTALVLNLAYNVATKAEQPVLIFSLEMSKEQLVDRMLARESGVSAWALRTGNLTDEDFEKIGHAMGVLSEAQIFIDDTPGLTISELRTKAKREAHRRPLGLIVVDYLQLMSGGSNYGGQANRVQEISEISRGLKGIARELNVPLVSLSQLSRSVESRNPQIPQLSDLRESGSIEQDADVVAFLYREDYYNPESDKQNILEVHFRKHRHGEVGSIELYFDREKQRITDIDRIHTPFDS